MKYPAHTTDPFVWGPKYWNMFFTRAKMYPKKNPSQEERRFFKNFYKGFINNLPCAKCNESFRIFSRQIPIEHYLDSRKDLIMWIYLIKDKVNKKLTEQGYPKKTPPFYIVLAKWY